AAGHDIAKLGQVTPILADRSTGGTIDNLLRLRISDATVDVSAGRDMSVQGVAALGVLQPAATQSDSLATSDLNALGLYSAHAALDLTANGSIAVANGNDNLLTGANAVGGAPRVATNFVANAVYPGTFQAAALTGDLDVTTPGGPSAATSVLLVPSPVGEL